MCNSMPNAQISPSIPFRFNEVPLKARRKKEEERMGVSTVSEKKL